LIRYGRELVVIGVPYVNWLRTHAAGVKDIDMPCNALEIKAKRMNGAKHERARA
jgi:hypothetical protein